MDNFENEKNVKIIIPNGIEINTTDLELTKNESNQFTDSDNLSSLTTSPMNAHKKITIKDFEIKSELGKGSYAKVVHAKFFSNNKSVALKILNKSFMRKVSKSHEALIEREILSSLDHPNIIKLLMTFHDKEKLYFVLEYAPNRDLATFIRSQGLLSFELSRFYAAEIVNALEYLQSKRIGHRDLKPENMILDSNWHIKLIDFSTAAIDGKYFDKKVGKFISTLENGGTVNVNQNGENVNPEDPQENGMKKDLSFSQLIQGGTLIGTAEYASPEMLNNRVYSHLTADIWALGCIIYKFLHGKTPFKANNEMIIFDNILNMKFTISKDIPDCAQDLIKKLLIENPEDRLGAGQPGTPNDINALKQHEFFKGINFNDLVNKKPPIKINNLERFKSSDNVLSYLSSKPINNSEDDLNISTKNIFSSSFKANIENNFDSPIKKVKKIKTCSSYLVNKEMSISEYSFESYAELQDEDIIEDYLFKFEDMKVNSGDIIQEGIVDKKAWVFFYPRKLKLYSDGKLEIWNTNKNILKTTIFINSRTKVEMPEKNIFEILEKNKSHKFKTTEKEVKKWVNNFKQFIESF